MSSINELTRKIRNAEDLQSIVKTMKSLAAVSIRQYERAVESLQEYYRTLTMGFQAAMHHHGVEHLVPHKSPRHRVAIVFGSDQGLCGTINETIASYLLETWWPSLQAQHQQSHGGDTTKQATHTHMLLGTRETHESHSETDIDGTAPQQSTLLAASVPNTLQSITWLVVGERIASQLEGLGLNIHMTFHVPASIAGVTSMVQELLFALEEIHMLDLSLVIDLFNNRPRKAGLFAPRHKQLWPLHRGWLHHLQHKDWPTRCLPAATLTQDWSLLVARLLRQHLFASLYQACVESLASEHSSRLAAMQSAERNIDAMLERMRHQYHQERQDAITSELLDISSGFEALRKQFTGG